MEEDMSILKYRAFLTTIEHNSLTKAAEVLGYTQPSFAGTGQRWGLSNRKCPVFAVLYAADHFQRRGADGNCLSDPGNGAGFSKDWDLLQYFDPLASGNRLKIFVRAPQYYSGD